MNTAANFTVLTQTGEHLKFNVLTSPNTQADSIVVTGISAVPGIDVQGNMGSF